MTSFSFQLQFASTIPQKAEKQLAANFQERERKAQTEVFYGREKLSHVYVSRLMKR